MDRDEYRRTSLKTWNDLAPTWDEHREEIAEPVEPVRERMMEWLAPKAGETLLDIACGSGEMSELVSPVVGDSGHVICTDFSPEMVAVARRRGERLGLSNVEYRELDAEQMDLDDGSVDAAVCRFGYMLMADRDAALRQTRRVLRDGGRLVFSVWGEPMRNPWVLVPGSVLIERGIMPPPDPEGPGIFALGDRDKIAAAMAAAGFTPVGVEDVEIHNRVANREELWERVSTTMGPLATAIAAQPEEEQVAVRAAIEERAEPFRDGEGYHLTGVAYVVLAETGV
jgi:SAM-dependent methyltransferase